jgi:hypothetical protein
VPIKPETSRLTSLFTIMIFSAKAPKEQMIYLRVTKGFVFTVWPGPPQAQRVPAHALYRSLLPTMHAS